MAAKRTQPGGVSSEAVQSKTGLTWDEWLEVLDSAGGEQMSHKEIVAYIDRHFDIGGWWQQMVTVGYEQARGMRQKHETTSGYQIGKSKTIAVSLSDLYRAWEDSALRQKWLPETAITIRTATKEKSMRITWPDGSTSVEAMFYEKGPGKSQIVVNHSKVPDAQTAKSLKEYWGERLDQLKVLLESDRA